MLGYSSTDVFSAEAKRYAFRASSIVAALPDKDGELRCHEVARVVAHTIGSEFTVVEGIADLANVWPESEQRIYVVDGWYGMPQGPKIDHSWLLLKPKAGVRPAADGMVVLLDTYAVGRLPMVQMLDTQMELTGMYADRGVRADIKRDQVDELVALVRSLFGWSL